MENYSEKVLKYWQIIQLLDQNEFIYDGKKTLNKVIEKIENTKKEKKKYEIFEKIYSNTCTKKEIEYVDIINEINYKVKCSKEKLNLLQCTDIEISVGIFNNEDSNKELMKIINSRCDISKLEIEKIKNNDFNLFSLKIDSNNNYKKNSLFVSPICWFLIEFGKNVLDKDNYNKFVWGIENKFLKSNYGIIDTKIIFNIFDYLKGMLNFEVKFEIFVKFIIYDSENKIELPDSYKKLDFFSNDINMVLNNLDICGDEKKFIESKVKKNNYLEKIDLFENNKKSQKEFIEILFSDNLPMGKWPSGYSPALMQQVAINIFTSNGEKYTKLLKERGNIFSVDGPPGTGKTTLLKEIIANSIVEKANILCKYDNPDDMFDEGNFIYSLNSKKIEVFNLVNEKINDYSILITSSNNNAVENITKELPLKNSIKLRGKALEEYNKNDKIKNLLLDLELDDNCWSFISIALGKKINIDNFCLGVLNKLLKKGKKDSNSWKKEYERLRRKFSSQYKKVLKIKQDKINLENLKIDKFKLDNELCREKKDYLQKYQVKLDDDFLRDEINKVERNKVLYSSKLNCFNKLFKRKYFNECKKLKEQADEKLMKLENILKINNNLECINKKIDELSANTNIFDFDSFIKYLLSGDIKSVNLLSIEDENFDKERELLFILAFKMNLAFVLASEKCLKNLESLTYYWGKNINMKDSFIIINDKDKKMVSSLYQSLFIFVPVISSTFSSISIMFNDVEERNKFGYLIIDEAGQAQPYMALGALYRCKKAMIVGDPKQVEPVVVDNLKLIKYCFKMENVELDEYTSTDISVQNLADELNQYGSYIDGEWLGCPLLVHRRCIDPMFKISNEISYDNLMINKTKVIDFTENELLFKDKSCWINCTGNEIGDKNHFVEDQGELIFKLLWEYYSNNKKMPDLFIITPFITVEEEIVTMLIQLFKKELNNDAEIKIIKSWVDKNIGTVHKFQGKEAKEVIFVLGCDLSLENSWTITNFVNSNIVNVALTRAKYRICVIGDIRLWKSNIYLKKVYNELVKIDFEKINKIIGESKSISNGKKINDINNCFPNVNAFICGKDVNGEPDIYLDTFLENTEKIFNIEDSAFESIDFDKIVDVNIKNYLLFAIYVYNKLNLSIYNSIGIDFSCCGILFCKVIEITLNIDIIKTVVDKGVETDNKKIKKVVKDYKNGKNIMIGTIITFLSQEEIKVISYNQIDEFIENLIEFKELRNKCAHPDILTLSELKKIIKICFLDEKALFNESKKVIKKVS